VNLGSFGFEMLPIKGSLEHGMKDTTPNETAKQIEMQSVNNEKIF
jgi:hypothetical protein